MYELESKIYFYGLLLLPSYIQDVMFSGATVNGEFVGITCDSESLPETLEAPTEEELLLFAEAEKEREASRKASRSLIYSPTLGGIYQLTNNGLHKLK